jgi:hypothetical protein
MIDKKFDKYINDYNQHCQRIFKSTQLKHGESAADKAKRMKKLEANYIDWFEYYFAQYAKSPCGWFHKKIANLIIKNKIINLLAEIYRSGAKSVHLGMGIPLYLYFTKDLFYMLLIGQTDPKAKKLISKIQAQLQFNQKLINDYGTRFKFGDWSTGDFTTIDGVKFKAMSSGQSPRGESEEHHRPDYILFDDVDTKKRVNNDRLSRELKEFAEEDAKGCFDEGGERQRFVVANNNFHKNTLINQLKIEYKAYIKKAKEKKRTQRHYIIHVPAVKSLETFEPNWPEKTSVAHWREKYDETPYRSFMREYMHVHIQDGTIFKHDNIHFKKRLQLRQYDSLILYADLSYKEQGDYKAMVLLGKIGREYHILKVYCRKSTRAAAAKWLYDLYEDWDLKKYNIRYFIEGLFAQDEFVNDFDLEGDTRGYHVPVVADNKQKGSKFDRVESMAGYYERNNIFYDLDLEEDPDTMTGIDQVLAFEKGSTANDDYPDAQQSGIVKANEYSYIDKFEVRVTTRADRNKRKKNRY